MFWAAHGKSAWETAQILGLTETTVKTYIANACKKLDAQNKVHAVAICMNRRLFTL
ncbi:helix-turn-helix domain-containing protein [Roseovarius mucosus]|uniref:helix-turn-helix transcriptional regulator n=1 Tax=Roseovarius mucosus TaxID=215743 RepID=UPI0018DFC297